ncbi:DUF4190 domain-containing protein [Aquipuribacter sp. MA13-6]|uniref:DUF4190 domain-containing protein n=1 Tax=unclassified Aquipuribacter TaxID=2635084 RepID=UPI003EF0257D
MSNQYPPSPQLGDTPDGAYGAPVGTQNHPGQPPAPQGTDVVSILGLVFAFLFWPIGLVLSLVGISRTGRGKRNGRGLAIAGAIISVIAGIIAVVVIVAIAGAASNASTELDAISEELDADIAEIEASVEAEAPADVAAPAEDEVVEDEAADEGVATAVALGEPATVDGVTFTVTSEDCGETTVGQEFLETEAQGVFCLFGVTVANGGNEPLFFDSSNVTGYIGDTEYGSDSEATIYLEDNDAFLEEINPGNTIEATVVFDVPADTLLERLELSPGFLSFDKAVVTLR